MSCDNPTDRGSTYPSTPAEADRKVEWAVLAFLLDRHPDRLTIPETSRALNEGAQAFESEDAVERAIRELVGAGLLHCESGFVVPTHAALHFWRLEEGR